MSSLWSERIDINKMGKGWRITAIVLVSSFALLLIGTFIAYFSNGPGPLSNYLFIVTFAMTIIMQIFILAVLFRHFKRGK